MPCLFLVKNCSIGQDVCTMDSLEEQLRQLTILNSRSDEGYVRTGKVAALVENLQQKVSAEQSNVHSKTKMAPTIPPKPIRKTIEMPQVHNIILILITSKKFINTYSNLICFKILF